MRPYFLIGCYILLICNNAIAKTGENGKNIYNNICSSCHMSDGSGIPGVFPALRCSPIVKLNTKETIKIIMFGKPGTAMFAYGTEMPQKDLKDIVLFIQKDFCGVSSNSKNVSKIINNFVNDIPKEERYTKESQVIKDKKRDKEYEKYLEEERNGKEKKKALNLINNPNALFVASYKYEKENLKLAKYGYNLILNKFPSSQSAIEAINRLDRISIYERLK